MNVIEALINRRSIRDFRPESVPKETILKILEAAVWSPSTSNTQCWEIYVVGGDILERIRKFYITQYENNVPGKTEIPANPPEKLPPAMVERMEKMRNERLKLSGVNPNDPKAMKNYFAPNFKFFGAKIIVVLCMARNLGVLSFFDLGLLSQSIMLAAQHYGVDSVPALSMMSYPDILREELEIPNNLIITMGIALGYANTDNIITTYRSSRRPFEEAVTFKGI